ncbi:RNA-directed DNA polymerase from mobile element jockey [Trichonephila clavipes]|nr:RNA-directed DNA polymerase from mobile element jockey [Trichonephila clavipes]
MDFLGKSSPANPQTSQLCPQYCNGAPWFIPRYILHEELRVENPLPDSGMDTIEWTFQVKYLGLILNDNLTYKPHFEETTKKFWKKFYSLIDILGRKSKLSLKNRLFVYKQYIRPILLYGCAIWGSAGNIHIDNLQRLQNRTLRLIARAPRFLPRYILHEELREEPIHTIIAELASNFHSSIPYHSNETINSQNHFRNLPPSTHRMPHNASSLIPSF